MQTAEASTLGADVGDVERTRAGPGRCRPRRTARAGPGRRRRRRAGRAPGAARPRRRRASSARRARSAPRATSWPGLAQAGGDRGAGAQRDVVLGGAPAARSPRPSRSQPRWRASRRTVVGVEVVEVGRWSALGLGEHADDDRHLVAAAEPRARRSAPGAITRPSSLRSSVSCSTTSTVSAATGEAGRAPCPRTARSRSGTTTVPAPFGDDDRHLVAAQQLRPRSGSWPITRALGLVGVAGVDVRDQAARRGAATRATACWSTDQVRHADQLRALRDEQRHGRTGTRRSVPGARVRVEITVARP